MRGTDRGCYREFIVAAATQMKCIIWMRIVWVVAQLVDFDAGQCVHHIRFVNIGEGFQLQINMELRLGISKSSN